METGVVFLLALARITTVVMTAPVLGNRVVAIRIRLALAIVLTLAAIPLVQPPQQPISESTIVSAFCSEVVIGASLGLGVTILFSAAQMAGTVIAQMAGIQIAGNLDPQTGENSSPVSQMFGILSLAVFAMIGGPELVLTGLLDTFIRLPLATSLELSSVAQLLTQLLQQSFVLTLRGVAPAVAALIISTLVIGLISRTYPQMNLLGLGLNSNLLVMLLAIFFTLGGSVWLFVDDLGETVSMISSAIESLQTNPEASPQS